MKQTIVVLLSALLCVQSIHCALVGSVNTGSVLVWLGTAAMLLYARFRQGIDAFCAHGPGFVFKVLFLLGCALFTAVLCSILTGQAGARGRDDAAAVIVLGCGVRGETPSKLLECRLETALEYWQAHPELPVAVCGGKGSGERITEAEAMRRWLVTRGVPESSILCEDKSTSTAENFAFVRGILADAGVPVTAPVVFVTNGFHCRRAGTTAANLGFTQAAALAAPIPLGQVLPCYIREVMATVHNAVLCCTPAAL